MKIFTFFLYLFHIPTLNLQGQNDGSAVTDLMQSSGKIYVVVAVLSVIFIGIVIYLAMLDRRVSSLEKQNPASEVK